MDGKLSRAGLYAGLSRDAWVVLFQKEDATENAVFNYRGVDLFMHASELNTANVECIIQSSVDGATWTNVSVLAAPIVPGGDVSMNAMFSGRWVRVLLFSNGTGRVDATLGIPEDQVTPGLWPDVSALACASYCEISSET